MSIRQWTTISSNKQKKKERKFPDFEDTDRRDSLNREWWEEGIKMASASSITFRINVHVFKRDFFQGLNGLELGLTESLNFLNSLIFAFYWVSQTQRKWKKRKMCSKPCLEICRKMSRKYIRSIYPSFSREQMFHKSCSQPGTCNQKKTVSLW